MFDFFSMAGNYEQRKVVNFQDEKTGLTIDTVAVTDSERPYETGIEHPRYNDGDWVIVELYDSKELAKVGHKKWVSKMTKKKLPQSLTDVSCSTIANLKDVCKKDWREKLA